MLDYDYIKTLTIDDVLLFAKYSQLADKAKDCASPIQNLFKKFNNIPKDTKDAVIALVPLTEKANFYADLIQQTVRFPLGQIAINVSSVVDTNKLETAWLTHYGVWQYFGDSKVSYSELLEGIDIRTQSSKLSYKDVKTIYRLNDQYSVNAEGIFDFLIDYILVKNWYICGEYQIPVDLRASIPDYFGNPIFYIKNRKIIELIEKKNKKMDSFARFLVNIEESHRLVSQFSSNSSFFFYNQ